MNSLALAKDHLRKAESRLRALELLFYQEQSYDDVVREAQELVELVLKGVLRCMGIDPPKRHDVGAVLRAHRDQLPTSWQDKLDWIIAASLTLFQKRGQAFYGDEVDLIPASELFDETEARQSLTWATDLVRLYQQMLTDLSRSEENQGDEED